MKQLLLLFLLCGAMAAHAASPVFTGSTTVTSATDPTLATTANTGVLTGSSVILHGNALTVTGAGASAVLNINSLPLSGGGVTVTGTVASITGTIPIDTQTSGTLDGTRVSGAVPFAATSGTAIQDSLGNPFGAFSAALNSPVSLGLYNAANAGISVGNNNNSIAGSIVLGYNLAAYSSGVLIGGCFGVQAIYSGAGLAFSPLESNGAVYEITNVNGQVTATVIGVINGNLGASVITVEGDVFYPHTVGGVLVWSNP